MIYDITTKEQLLKTKSKMISLSSSEKIIIRGFHVTTSSNNCEEILQNGIEPLNKVLSNPNSELTEFLRDFNLSFNIDNMTVKHGERTHSIKEYPYEKISKLLTRGPYAFLFCANIKSYGEIHMYPEILKEMEKNGIIDVGALEKWKKSKKAYKLTFEVPSEYISRNYLAMYKQTEKERLLAMCDDMSKPNTPSLEIAFEKIPKEFITGIEQVS